MNTQWHEIMMTRLDAVIAERDEMKIRMRLCMAAAVISNAVVVVLATCAL